MTELASLARLDAIAQAELCGKGDLTAEELWEACRARIEALNPLLGAVVTVASDRTPATAGRQFGAGPSGGSSGPLSGVPFLAKDALPWPQLRWAMGSRLFASKVATQHTPFGKRLSDAGLACIGKTAMSELGLLASTETLLEGVTHNPWELSRSAGGSSGGSAAAVAAGLVPFAHANDGGGSIRIPASVCGVFGFKPSRGRTVPASFVSSDLVEMTSDHCVSRSVRDSALVLSLTEDRSFAQPVGFVREPIARPLRIATFTRTMMGSEPEPAVRRAQEETAALLVELGHHVESIAAPAYDGAALAHAFFVVAGAAVAGLVDTIDRTRGTPVQTDELEPFTWALYETFLARGPDALNGARTAFANAVRVYREATAAYDVVLTPTLAIEAWPVGFLSPILDHEELVRRTARALGYTPIANIVGCPAMSVPLDFPDGGVPIGSHFAAAPGADALLLGLAYQLEEARPWKDRWPPYSVPALF